ncbi:blastoderm-specific protein 25D isoform X2 [Venturia canescens]|uniref:blastoderm-specific protein 25D isoform X2 n=1 Tax=Venturia canescens TaxID=32260 RepID=UPI001C9C650F|nr:blastoderm-specific protein 25D isoform X2 [Venturia canescens]
MKDAMEGENGDPYEERLLAVFNSCLEKGQGELRLEHLGKLCDKLQLEERSDLLISLLSQDNKPFVSFATFRDALLKLLAQTEGGVIDDSTRCWSSAQASTEHGNLRHSPRRSNGGATNGHSNGPETGRLSGVGYATLLKEMPERMFEKLDTDRDGLINFEEFALLFENDKNNVGEQQSLDWSGGCSSGDNVVYMLGPHQTGYAKIRTIVGMWEVAGVSDAAMLLSDLGFTSTEIRLTDLITVICEELKNLRDEPDNAITSTHAGLLKGALTLYQEEVRCMNNLVEHLSGERHKLRIDVAEANERANLLAQEIDEHHVRLEKSRQDQLKQLEFRHAEITRELSIRCTSEREAHNAALKLLEGKLQNAQHEEHKLRDKLADVLQENQTLENEIEKLCDQVTKLKTTNGQLLMQLQHLAAEHEEIDTSNDGQESEQIIQLVERIKRLQREIALLRDQNDELNTELEFMKNRSIPLKPLSDEVEMEEEKDAKAENTEKSWERVTGDCVDFAKNAGLDDNKLSDLSNDIGLESNLPRVSEPAANRPDETKLYPEPEVECEERASESLRDFVVSQTEKSKLASKSISHSDDSINVTDKAFNNLDTKNGSKVKTSTLRDYPPRREEATSLEVLKTDRDKSRDSSLNGGQTLNPEEHSREGFDDNRIEEQETKHSIEKKQLADRCAELERSLDLLRSEYEQCEDYWAAKLEEERQLFEQEQKISDDKFSELIAKMAEYEEQFSPGDKSRNDGRLSPIEEKFHLEQQYADLEDEYERFKTQTRELLIQKDDEMKELQDRLTKDKGISQSPTREVSTQYSLDDTDLPHIPLTEETAHGLTVNKKLFRYVAPPSAKLDEITESPVTSSSLYTIPSAKLKDCYCQQIEAYNSMEELCRMHKAELHRLYRKKLEIDHECMTLTKQKETLIRGVSDLKNLTVMKRLGPMEDAQEPNRILSIDILKALNDRLQAQEKKRRNLKISLTHQQQQAERILQQTWQQHCQEVEALRFALQGTKDQLKNQVCINQEQAERLAKADLLSTDLYVQNAHLMASVKRLEQHCHILAQFGGESTSV